MLADHTSQYKMLNKTLIVFNWNNQTRPCCCGATRPVHLLTLHHWTVQVQCGGVFLVFRHQVSQSGPPDEVCHRIAVRVSPVLVPEELGVVMNPTGRAGGRGGGARTRRGKTWDWGSSGAKWEAGQSGFSLGSVTAMVVMDVKLISGLTGAVVTEISLIGGKMHRAAPRSWGAGNLRVAPDSDDQCAVPGFETHYMLWCAVTELDHWYSLTW